MSAHNKRLLAVFIGVVVVTPFFLFTNAFGTLFIGSENEAASGESLLNIDLDSQNFVSEDVIVGEGTEAISGNLVTVHYIGVLSDGTPFDSSHSRGEPFQFILGGGQVIQGWDMGVAGMKVGGKRILVIPPDLAYGSNAVGAIPPDSTLIFEIELLDVSILQ
ncbi:FKBP-type peptidyl-prolyl cis-trans isomerase [Patescibacteria group bacterium]|nr:FKBP-type peptidyl-prolyl cis-trans isomerase [Patescibacteria group bacterium]